MGQWGWSVPLLPSGPTCPLSAARPTSIATASPTRPMRCMLQAAFKRRFKTQAVLPSAETAAMLFWDLLASGQITMRKGDGWQSLAETPAALRPVDRAA